MTIRQVPPEEYAKYRYPDYPAKSLPALVKHFRKTEPDYYDTLKNHIAEHGITEPAMVRFTDPRGRPLKQPEMDAGHHRAAVAYELGLPLPVGDREDPDDFATTRAPARAWFTQHGEEKTHNAPSWKHGARTAARQPFEFREETHETGGTKYPRFTTLTAHHPETGEQAGELRYYPPKRKKAPITVYDMSGDHPGATSALFDEMEARHPGSRITHIDDKQIGGKEHNSPLYGTPTDWKTVHPELPEQIHRGMSVTPEQFGSLITQGHGPAAEHAEILRDHLKNKPLGMHWSSDEKVSTVFSHRNIRDPRTDVPVVLHADRPAEKDIEKRPDVLKNNGVWQHGYEFGDAEVPIRRGRPVTIRGISWKPDAEHPEADENGWVHHTFSEPLRRTAAAEEFTPSKRLFGPTFGLDHRLFDGDHLKPEVRAAVLHDLNEVLQPLLGSEWMDFVEVYFAGSEASEWTSETLEGNGDFDTLLGVDYDRLRAAQPHSGPFAELTDAEIDDDLNQILREQYNRSPWVTPWGDYDRTGYVNAEAYDIRNIRPYAAYDLNKDDWAVRPPHLPDWSVAKMNPAVVAEARAVAAYIESVLALPEPMRTQQGAALWDHLHGDRSRAFGPNGEGWYDPANVIEKWLDQEGLWAKLLHLKHNAVHGTYDEGYEPVEWSNTPMEALASRGDAEPPEKLYHVTTNLPGVQATGLKSYIELGQRFSSGLGSGNADPRVSLTQNLGTAHHLLHSLHEYHDVLNGKITADDLLDKAKRGIGAKRPYDEDLHVVGGMENYEKAKALEGDRAEARGIHSVEDRPEGWEPDGEPIARDKNTGSPIHVAWTRPVTPEERIHARSDLYKSFAWARHYGGGHMNPLFLANDPIAFAHHNPKHFALLHVRPKPGARGEQMNTRTEGTDAGEWRMPSDQLDVVGHQHRDEIPPREAAWDGEIDPDDYERSHTDWDRYYDKIRPEIHRGMVLNLDPEDHDRVHDPSGTDEERGEALLHALKRRPVGMHWSDFDPEFAQQVTEDEATQTTNPVKRSNLTQVVLHADKPKREHIETDMHRLVDKGVMGYASGSEGEIPLKEGAPVNVYGVSWKHRQEPHWHYHELDYPQTMRHTAAPGGDYSERAADLDMPDEIHRGLALRLPQDVHDAVRDESRPVAERAQVLADHLRVAQGPAEYHKPGQLGHHWTTNPGTAEGYSKKSIGAPYDPETGKFKEYSFEPDPQYTRVVLHAGPPKPSHLLSSERTLKNREIFGYEHSEKEVPFRRNAPITLKGISFGPNERGAELNRHDFDQPLRFKAAAERFYHGTGEVFAPGDMIEPRMPQAGGTRYPYVYTSKDPARAYGFGVMKSSDPHVYEVEHTGEYRKDPHTPGSAYRTRQPVRVIREVKDPPKTPWEERTAGARGDLPEKLFIGIHQPHDWDDDRLHQLDEHYSGWADESPSSEVDLNGPDELRYVHAYDLGHPDPTKRRLPIGFIRYHENNVPSSVGRSYISVDNMAVHPDYRRRGVASAMQDKLADTYRGMHIDHGNRTPEGEAWARGWKKRASSDGDYWVDCDQGHEHWGANGAAGMLIRHTDKAGTRRYLLQKRAPWVDHGDTWGIPGGALGGSERPEEGARRETEEEMGELPHDLRHSHTVTDDHGGWKYHTVIADSPHMFTPEGGDDDESQGHGWFTADEMKDLPLHPGFKKTWDKVRRSRTDKMAAASTHWIAHEHEVRGPDEYEHEDEMPPYIGEDIDRRNEKFDRAWNRLSPDEQTTAHRTVQRLANRKMYIGTNAADKILRDGRMSTLAEGMGNQRTVALPEDYAFDRRALEHHVMGVPEDERPEHQPIYGSLHDDPSENVYGRHQLELKPHVRARTSVTMGDSLDNMLRGYHIDHVPHLSHEELRAMTDPQELPNLAAGVDPKSYVEMQVHGGVGLNDIAAVHVHERRRGLSDRDRKVMAAAKERGIPVVHHKPDPNLGLTDEQVAILKGHE